MTDNTNSKKVIVMRRAILIILIVMCLGSRFLYLEADPPPWGVSFYQPADEGPYAYLAINHKIYGSFNPSSEVTGGYSTWVSENFIMNIVGNLFNTAGFMIFGNNYYGLRSPYIIIFFINFVLLAVLLNKLRKRYSPDDNTAIDWMLLMLLWVAVDFSFLLSSRYVEPSAVRMTVTLLAAIIYISYPKSDKLRYFLIGSLITFSCFLVYITNVFLYLAIGMALLYVAYTKGARAFAKATMWFIAGCAVSFVITEVYYLKVWDTEALTNALESVMSFSKDSMATGSSSDDLSMVERMLGVAVSVFRVFSANSFAYNIPALFAMIATYPALFRIIGRRKDCELMFLALIPVAFSIQSIVAYDTVSRKMIIVFPIIICNLFATYLCYKKDVAKDSSSFRGISSQWLIFTTLLVTITFLYRFLLFDQSADDYSMASAGVVFLMEYAPVMILAALYFVHRITNIVRNGDDLQGPQEVDERKKLKGMAGSQLKWIGTLLALMCLCNLAYDYNYIWRSPDYGEKNAMIAMADYVDGQYVLGGGFQLGYTLYNNMRPIVTDPKGTMKQAGDTKDRAMVFEYSNEKGKMDSYLNRTYFKKSKKRFIPDYLVERNYQAFGKVHNMCIYRMCSAKEYAKFLREREENDDVKYPLKKENIKGSDIDMITCLDVYGDIHGDIDYDLYGDVYGNIYGDVNATIYGTVNGEIYGEVNGSIVEREE